MKKNHQRILVSLLACMLPLVSMAQGAVNAPAEVPTLPINAESAPAQAIPVATRHSIEIYTNGQRLSSGFPDWSELGVKGNYEVGPNLLQMELATMRRFGETGVYIGLGDTVTLSPDWFATLSAGAGDGASYLPRYRVDGFINRKLLEQKNLVATLGLGYYSAPDGHIDRSVSLGGTYYFSQPWIVQAEVKFNTSNPGKVRTQQQFVAATWGRDKQTQITGRYAWGAEGYQAIGTGASLVDFRSHQSSLDVRHWLAAQWGVSAKVEHYKNPFYQRNGLNLGFFWQFQ